jgi:hypothetical protein
MITELLKHVAKVELIQGVALFRYVNSMNISFGTGQKALI